VSQAGVCRPSLWAGIERQIAAGAAEWSMRAVGRIMGSCRRVLMSGPEVNAEEYAVILKLMSTAGRAMLQRRDDVTFHEASDLVMTLAALPVGRDEAGEDAERLLRLSCETMQRSPTVFPPCFLASGFHAVTSMFLLRLHAAAEGVAGPEDAETALRGLRALAPELNKRLFLCAAGDMVLVAEALWAFLGHGPLDLAWELGAHRLLLVQQREGVRKAHELGFLAAVRFARLSVEAAVAPASRGDRPPARVDGQRGLLRPWFLPDMLAYCEEAGPEESPGPQQLAWLSAAVAAEEAGLESCSRSHPWPRLDASDRGPASGSAAAFAYGACPA